jgi:hypothetical protein
MHKPVEAAAAAGTQAQASHLPLSRFKVIDPDPGARRPILRPHAGRLGQ